MTDAAHPRRPRVFAVDDPSLKAITTPIPETDTPRQTNHDELADEPADAAIEQEQTLADRLTHGTRWATILVSAATGLVLLSFGLWVSSFISAAFSRNDWIGWTAAALLTTAGISALIIITRELAGLIQLRSLKQVRALAETARKSGDLKQERVATNRLVRLLSNRDDMIWPVARFKEHARDVRDPGDLLILAEREFLAPLDRQAQRCILGSARRVSLVTAVSPTGLLSVAFVLFENLRMLRAVAALYGGRPGLVGSLRLARMVFLHILATGGIALTDDLLGQFIGQDLLRRLSRRLGEGVFNGALTARIGVSAVGVIRPLPFISCKPPRLRSLIAQLFSQRTKTTTEAKTERS